jgi:hypothetical protein
MIGRIYCIRSHQTTKCYIGSTKQILCRRFSNHKTDYKSFLSGKRQHSITSFEILQYDDAYIELIKETKFESTSHMKKREGQLIREMDCVNKLIAGRTNAEWREDNKEIITEKNRINYVENRIEIRAAQTAHYDENKIEIREKVRLNRIDKNEEINKRDRAYYQTHKQQFKEKNARNVAKNYAKHQAYKKVWYEQNKERILKKVAERYLLKKEK